MATPVGQQLLGVVSKAQARCRLFAQPMPSGKVRFLALSALSLGRSCGATKGRLQKSASWRRHNHGKAGGTFRGRAKRASFERVLTRDNTLLSRPTIEPPGGPRPADADALGRSTRMSTSAVDCTNSLLAEVEAYVQAGIASATKRAYRANLSHFEAWGGTIPATDAQVAAYLAYHADVLKVSTLTRVPSPCSPPRERPRR
jgi:hypothetical protein